MTRYVVDDSRAELIATWETGHGAAAAVVASLPADLDTRQRLALAGELSGLSNALWRCYTHPASAADSLDVNTEGWRRQQTRDGFAAVLDHLRAPNLPHDDGSLIVSYDPVEERADRVGRALHAASDADLTAAVVGEVEAEIAAVANAELGDLSGRSVQAVQLTRQDASPVQVAVADEILARNPLGGDALFLELDPTAACVAAAHWLKAAADVVAHVSGRPASQVVLEADDIEAIPVSTPTDVLELMDADQTPTEIVTMMIRDAMAVADGRVPDIGVLRGKLAKAEELANEHAIDEASRAELLDVRLTPLDPQRPAPDMLEDLLTGVRGCWLLYREYAERPGGHPDDDETDDETDETLNELDDAIDAAFCADVRAEATSQRHRLGLEPAPHPPALRDIRAVAADKRAGDEGDGDEEGHDINLEAEDTCEHIVAIVLDVDDPEVPRQIVESMLTVDNEDIGRVLALLVGRGVGYLVHMKERRLSPTDVDAAVHWVGTEFGAEYAGPAAIVASLAGHPDSHKILAEQVKAPHPTFEQLSGLLGPDLFPATIWLCTGLVATTGNGDVAWLRQYRPDPHI